MAIRSSKEKEGSPGAELFIHPLRVGERTSPHDVTNDERLLEKARMEVANQYKRLSTRGLTEEEVYEDLCSDGYDTCGHSSTIVTLTDINQEKPLISGTVRLVKGNNGDVAELPPLDAMKYFDVPTWPHRLEGIPDNKVGELGRFVIPAQFRTEEMKDYGVSNEITRQLYFEALSVGRKETGIERLYAIMPSYVVEQVTESGISVREIENATLVDRHETFDRYDVYWRKLKPRLFEFQTYE
jgi:hypothetical protein